jgi:hypothetical protein
VRFGGWPPPTQRGGEGLSATLLESLAGHVLTTWGRRSEKIAMQRLWHVPPCSSPGHP